MRQEIGARKGIKITKKGEMIMRGTAMEGNPVNPAHVNDKTIPKNHADAGLDPILKDHVNKGTVLIDRKSVV